MEKNNKSLHRKKLLIIRFSALGDVAMTIPVVSSLAKSYPELRITVLSRKSYEPLFSSMPENVTFLGADLKGKHCGFNGLCALLRELARRKFDYIADFHSVTRSHILRLGLAATGAETAKIDKGRKDKKRLIKQGYAQSQPLRSSFERYKDVLSRLGLTFNLSFDRINIDESVFQSMSLPDKGTEKWIGIAPFAQHQGKIYPLEKMERVIQSLAEHNDYRIFLFGFGEQESGFFEKCSARKDNVLNMAGKYSMKHELALMSRLDVMLSMDSANMHLASIMGTPVVSIWGATHPYAGFMGWGQKYNNTVQTDLPCRPCSVYGNKPCERGDYACLNNITPETIVNAIKKSILT